MRFGAFADDLCEIRKVHRLCMRLKERSFFLRFYSINVVECLLN